MNLSILKQNAVVEFNQVSLVVHMGVEREKKIEREGGRERERRLKVKFCSSVNDITSINSFCLVIHTILCQQQGDLKYNCIQITTLLWREICI